MASVSLLISGLFLGVMIGISWYGARTLPADARIPLHFVLIALAAAQWGAISAASRMARTRSPRR